MTFHDAWILREFCRDKPNPPKILTKFQDAKNVAIFYQLECQNTELQKYKNRNSKFDTAVVTLGTLGACCLLLRFAKSLDLRSEWKVILVIFTVLFGIAAGIVFLIASSYKKPSTAITDFYSCRFFNYIEKFAGWAKIKVESILNMDMMDLTIKATEVLVAQAKLVIQDQAARNIDGYAQAKSKFEEMHHALFELRVADEKYDKYYKQANDELRIGKERAEEAVKIKQKKSDELKMAQPNPVHAQNLCPKPECRAPLHPEAKFCNKCGHNLDPNAPKTEKVVTDSSVSTPESD
jgi:hypothetical protein